VVLGSSDTVLPEDLPAAILEIEPPSGLAAGKFQSAVQDTKKQSILTPSSRAMATLPPPPACWTCTPTISTVSSAI